MKRNAGQQEEPHPLAAKERSIERGEGDFKKASVIPQDRKIRHETPRTTKEGLAKRVRSTIGDHEVSFVKGTEREGDL